MTTKIMTRILSSALLTQLVLLPDFLYAQSDFYRGKTITIIHGRDRRRLGRSARASAGAVSAEIHPRQSHHRS